MIAVSAEHDHELAASIRAATDQLNAAISHAQDMGLFVAVDSDILGTVGALRRPHISVRVTVVRPL